MTKTEELLERLAELEHIQWQYWASVSAPDHPLLYVPYANLTEEQKEQDRIWAKATINLLSSLGYGTAEEAELPDNKAWHKNEREFEAYSAGRNEMIMAGYRKFKKIEVKE